MEQTTVERTESSTPVDEQEAYQVLLSRAHRKTGSIPPELLVRHVLAVTEGADWPVKREALEALLRRMSFGKTDGLSIGSRPAGGRLLGNYTTRRKGSPARPYQTRSILSTAVAIAPTSSAAPSVSASISSPSSRISRQGPGSSSARRSRARPRRRRAGIPCAP